MTDLLSPIQIDTRGVTGGVEFAVVGRVRWGWGGGAWDEWRLACSDGQTRWLSESPNGLMLTRQRSDLLALEATRRFAEGEAVRPSATIVVDGETLEAHDVREAERLEGEGDLSGLPRAGARIVSVDFLGASGSALCLQRGRDGVSAWFGRMVRLADLAPRNLRRLEGWAVPAVLS